MKTQAQLPLDSHRSVRIWLYILAVLIAVMVLVGGATRLTDSGLSITEWAPISGFLPPFTAADWQSEFLKYQTTDEFKQQNSAMTMDQFKVIYWWEWGHRFLGRLIGLFILVPMVFFWIRGKLDGWLKPATLSLFALICFQGFLGWWMVKSGLVDRVDVSQIRLAVHLTTALILLAAVIWVARSLAEHTHAPRPDLSWQGGAMVMLILLQIFVGGLVAGLDAGMAYNTWPKMNEDWLPKAAWVSSIGLWNLTDNAATVQFLHRMTAYLLWAAALLHAVSVSRFSGGTAHSHRGWLLFGLISVQAIIGIAALLLQVPISWALLHQFGGVVVLVFATAHWRAFSAPQISAFIAKRGGLNPQHATA